jgi:3-oxoacyl-[acyl-carrier-protein] synthase II
MRIAITGLGAVTPVGLTAPALLDGCVEGVVAIEDGEAVCRDFVATDFLSKKEARRTDRFAQLAMAASDEALAQAAGQGELPAAPERTACVLATGVGGLLSLEEDIETLRLRGPEMVSPLGVPRLMGNAAAAMVAMRHGVRGESYGLVAACASGAQAIGAAARMLYSGEADAVIAGGADSRTTRFTGAAYSLMGATSRLGISRPFDVRRDGFVPGEGAGILILERYDTAQARGATILGEILGYGASSDAHHLTAPHPEGRGAVQAMRAALAHAGIAPQDVDYINAHGTSTPLNDRTETMAIKEVFGEHAHAMPVSSVKGGIGHLQGAAGAAEVVVTLLALRARVAPPTLGLEQPDEDLDLDYVPARARALPGPDKRKELTAISNSFGFGGHNATVVIRVG